MNKEQEIVEYLKNKYNPRAIILHGSRARGLNRENSDWDFYVLVDSKVVGGSEQVNGDNLDVSIVPPEYKEYDIADKFGSGLNNATVLFDTNDEAKQLVEKAQKIYAAGKKFSQQELLDRKNRGLRLLERVIGTVDTPELQLYHLGTFYQNILRYWYELKGKWQRPPYIALKEIQEQDPELYQYLLTMATSADPNQKAQAAEKAYNKLF